MIKIIYCINDETLRNSYTDFDQNKLYEIELQYQNEIDFVYDHNFKTWNGGEGKNHSGFAYMKIGGTPVKTIEDAEKAVMYLIEDGKEWPSYVECKKAFDVLDIVRDCYYENNYSEE